MKLCNDGHKQIAFEEHIFIWNTKNDNMILLDKKANCPLCEALAKIEKLELCLNNLQLNSLKWETQH